MISGFIIAKNEEIRIAKAIYSLKKITDEIIVIDSGSTDKTVEIAKNLGVTVVFNKWQGYAKQKAFGESLCKYDWIINIDADEELSVDLQNEILQVLNDPKYNDYKAYYIDIVTVHRCEDPRIRRFAPKTRAIRLYNRKYAGFLNSTNYTTRDSVELNSIKPCYVLKHPALHRSISSFVQLIEKANFYSTEQAKDLVRLGRKPSSIRIFFEFGLSFFKAFFFRRYFVFGFNGFVDSMVFAFSRFIRLAKARELYIKNKNSDPEGGHN